MIFGKSERGQSFISRGRSASDAPRAVRSLSSRATFFCSLTTDIV